MADKQIVFELFCSTITGFTVVELNASVIDDYYKLIESIIGAKLFVALTAMMEAVVQAGDIDSQERKLRELIVVSPTLQPICEALTSLWYLGTWTQLPDDWYASMGLPLPGPNDPGRTHTPSALAYTEQLSYRAALAHAPGANPTGYASWEREPEA